MDVIDFKFGAIINPDTLRHFCRAINGVKVITGIPMDSKRVVVDQSDIMNYFEELKEITRAIPAKFIFNIDEAGCSSWADRHNTKFLCHANMKIIKYLYQKIGTLRDQASLVALLLTECR